MAEEQSKSGKWYGTAGKFVHGGVTLALAVTSIYLGTKDTSPSSLASIASTLESIAGHLETGEQFNTSELATVGEIVKYTSAIEGAVVEKAAGSPLPGVDAILIKDGQVSVPLMQTQSMQLGNGDRVSVSYITSNGNGVFTFMVNGTRKKYLIGSRLYDSEAEDCFIEFLGMNATNDEAAIRPFCN